MQKSIFLKTPEEKQKQKMLEYSSKMAFHHKLMYEKWEDRLSWWRDEEQLRRSLNFHFLQYKKWAKITDSFRT